jgi:F-type H+-transporting ATPase subunit alpha
VSEVRRFETEMLDYVSRHAPELLDNLATAKALDDDLVAALEKVVGEFKAQFVPSQPVSTEK